MDGDGDLAMENGRLEGFRKFWNSAVCNRVMEDWGRDEAELCKEVEY